MWDTVTCRCVPDPNPNPDAKMAKPAIPIWPSKTADAELERMQGLANIRK